MAQKKCLYEVLGIQSSATAEEIRSAYRREALRWHPDKVQHTSIPPEEAREKFQAVSNAYEVLSDPLERKWYDSHRSQILTSPTDRSEFEPDLWSFFSPSVYSGYGDNSRGFYAVYGGLFGKIHLQEQMFAKKFGSGIDSVRPAPAFGRSSTSYPDVAMFYDYWMSFRTVKDYSWCDSYDLGDAPNRKVKRVMEEENKKSRKREQRDFNEAVRQLAVFVKKRDKRVLEHQLEAQRIAREREAEMKARREEEKRERLRRVKEYEEAEWAKSEVLDGEEDGDGEEDREREEFYCVACEKRFRSQKQWENHEKSKKHIERASALKDVFRREDELLEKPGRSPGSPNPKPEPEVEPRRRSGSSNPKPEIETEPGPEAEPEVVSKVEPEPEGDDGDDDDEESSMLAAMMSSSSRRARATGDDDDDDDDGSSVAEEELAKPSKARRRLSKRREDVADRHSAIGAEVSSLGSTLEEVKLDDPPAEGTGTGAQKEEKRKAKKKAKKGASSAPAEQVKKPAAAKGGKSKQVAAPPSSICEICGTDFESRNSLFKHIESTKHIALKYKP